MTAHLRGEQVARRGELWLRVQAIDSPPDGRGLGAGRCQRTGSFDWQTCEIVFDVDPRAMAIEVGLGLAGTGTLWLDDVLIEPVSADVPLRNWAAAR